MGQELAEYRGLTACVGTGNPSPESSSIETLRSVPYSASSISSLYNVRMDWYWIGTRLVKDCTGLPNLKRP